MTEAEMSELLFKSLLEIDALAQFAASGGSGKELLEDVFTIRNILKEGLMKIGGEDWQHYQLASGIGG